MALASALRFTTIGLDFRHPFGDAAEQAEILGAAKRAEMADVEHTKKIVPVVTCEVSFGQMSTIWCLVSMYRI